MKVPEFDKANMFRRLFSLLIAGKLKENGEPISRISENRRPGSKGKPILLQVWTGPEGSRRMRLPDFITIGT